MVSFKGISARTFNYLKKIVTILGCLVFLLSIISPFFFARYPSSMAEGAVNFTEFWSFRSHTDWGDPFLRISFKSYENWFFDYWIKESAFRSEFLVLFPLMFMAQVATLTTGTVSVFVRKKRLVYVLLILCSFVIALMTYVSLTSKIDWSWHYQDGFWFAFASLFLFLAASMLEHRQEKNSILHNLPKNTDTITNTREA